jgi:hypothetical protein
MSRLFISVIIAALLFGIFPESVSAETYAARDTVVEAYKAKKSVKKKWRKTFDAEARWYTGAALGWRGAYGKLKSGQSVAMSASWRKKLGIKKRGWIYVKAPKRYKITGWKRVMDCGCARGTVDCFFANNSTVPRKFRRAGVVDIKVYVYKNGVKK